MLVRQISQVGRVAAMDKNMRSDSRWRNFHPVELCREGLTVFFSMKAMRRFCLCILLHARARERVVPISELVFGTLTQNRSSLSLLLDFAAIAGTPCIVDRVP